MTAARYDSTFEAVLAGIRQPARLIGEEAGAGPGFSRAADELRVVLGFPDTYEIAISNQALQILYHLARDRAGVGVERAYLPWVDAIAEMRRLRVPLLTLESWTPVSEAHVLAVTLQHEFHYTNLLEMLDLAGIPVHAADRGEEHPVVLVGGPACANFAPIASFVDAAAVGDGEELLPEVLDGMVAARRAGASRHETKDRLARINGVFVPGMSTRVRRRAISRLEGAPYPAACLVPLVAGVHDRAWVEVMRGCTRGCRFCQAGMWYRPVRERPADEVLRMAAEQLAESGHQELAFASLSTTDYSSLRSLLAAMAEAHPEVSLSLPSLRVDSASVRIAWLASPTGASLTLAPEAGSQRMRDIINKGVDESDILNAAEEAFRTGRSTLKLYFMIGLPWELDEDVKAIADLCSKIRQAGRRILGPRAGRLQLNVSVNTFIPKPFTPFQWAAMADRETVRRRQGLLRDRLRKPGIRLALSDPSKSYLEAALARGDEALGPVLEAAWSKGARFDAWTEQFNASAWADAFAQSLGTSAEEVSTTPLERQQALPWDVVEGVPDHDFLWGEWEKASRGKLTGDCRWNGCELCGACEYPPGNVLAPSREPEADIGEMAETVEVPASDGVAASDGMRGSAARDTQTPHRPSAGSPGRGLCYVARFSVTGRGRFLGHLDRVEAFRRGVRRAGGRLALSAGMRPKPLLTLALPLGVGVEGLDELCEFELAEEPAADFADRLAGALPGHARLLELCSYDRRQRLAARVAAASYEAVFSVDDGGDRTAPTEPRAGAQPLEEGRPAAVADSLAHAAARFERALVWTVEEARPDGNRVVDVKRYVASVDVRAAGSGNWALAFTAKVTPQGTARPESIVKALEHASGLRLTVRSLRRTHIGIE